MERRSFSKSELKQLRALAALAYERELSNALTHLAADFSAWKAGSLDTVSLAEAVREATDHFAHDLAPLYRLTPPLIVATALDRSALEPRDVPPKLLAKLHAHAV